MNSEKTIQNVVTSINNGGIGLLPTDTNYGLCVDPYNIKASERLYRLKKRDANKKLSLFISEPEQVFNYCTLSDKANKVVRNIINKYWPGPLGIVLQKNSLAPVSPYIYEDSIAVCCCKNPNLNKIIDLLGKPIGVTSANISGAAVSGLTTFEIAQKQFSQEIDFFIEDHNKSFSTMAGTIIKVDNIGNIHVLRQGDIVVSF